MRRRLKWLALPVALVVAAVVLRPRLRPSAAEAMHRFHAQAGDGETAEDQLVCPLVLAGPEVCGALVDAIAAGRPLRRYAIAAAGELRCRATAPALRATADDAAELDGVRADARTALRQVDGLDPPTMSYWDALRCRHE